MILRIWVFKWNISTRMHRRRAQVPQGWGLLKLRPLISLQAKYSILQKWALSCDDTCQIWTWYTIASVFFGDAKNQENNRTKEIGLVTPTPGNLIVTSIATSFQGRNNDIVITLHAYWEAKPVLSPKCPGPDDLSDIFRWHNIWSRKVSSREITMFTSIWNLTGDSTGIPRDMRLPLPIQFSVQTPNIS